MSEGITGAGVTIRGAHWLCQDCGKEFIVSERDYVEPNGCPWCLDDPYGAGGGRA